MMGMVQYSTVMPVMGELYELMDRYDHKCDDGDEFRSGADIHGSMRGLKGGKYNKVRCVSDQCRARGVSGWGIDAGVCC